MQVDNQHVYRKQNASLWTVGGWLSTWKKPTQAQEEHDYTERPRASDITKYNLQ